MNETKDITSIDEIDEKTFTMDKTEPDILEPDTPKTDILEPDTPEPDTPEPDNSEPDTPEPDTPEPDTPKPNTSNPNIQKPDEKKTPKTIKDKLAAELERQKQLKEQAKKAREKIRRLQRDLDRDTIYADIAKMVILAYRLTKTGTMTNLPENVRPAIPVDQNRLIKLLNAIPLKAATREKINELIN